MMMRTRVSRIGVVSIAVAATLAATGMTLSIDTQASPVPASAVATHAAATPSAIGDAAPAGNRSARQLADIDNSRVNTWVTRFTTSMRSDFSTYLERMSKYASTVSAKIAQRGMPRQLVYLPLIESGYKPTAKSPVKATGLWQFMTATARRYGLRVTSHVDERKDPAKSTDAALAYLSDLHDRFGSWYLAAAAYNAGPTTVQRALKRVTGKTSGTDADYYRIAGALPAETRDYVPKLIAAARIAENPVRYGFDVPSPDAG
ncbi:MAG TPA: lytic transglycosylase domain-containing protein [Gemmatimonadaceae bacterium]|nr:lytic transglycosylase domain-containing protein [Gemmatimonadaceae bacterium]